MGFLLLVFSVARWQHKAAPQHTVWELQSQGGGYSQPPIWVLCVFIVLTLDPRWLYNGYCSHAEDKRTNITHIDFSSIPTVMGVWTLHECIQDKAAKNHAHLCFTSVSSVSFEKSHTARCRSKFKHVAQLFSTTQCCIHQMLLAILPSSGWLPRLLLVSSYTIH